MQEVDENTRRKS